LVARRRSNAGNSLLVIVLLITYYSSTETWTNKLFFLGSGVFGDGACWVARRRSHAGEGGGPGLQHGPQRHTVHGERGRIHTLEYARR